MKAEQNVERTVHQVGKNVEKSLHEFSKHPIESTVEFVRGAGDAALADVTFNVVQRPYNSKHPVAYQAGQMVGHAVSTLAGMAETTGFAAVGTGGIVLDATGVGVVVGAPATAIAAAGVTHGATLASTGSANFAKSAKELYQRMSRSEGVSGGVSKGVGSSRPSWRQSEKDIGDEYPGYREQVSFKNGSEVKHGTKNSSRPDFYINGHSIEVKNYKLTTSSGRNNLIRNVSEQINKRMTDLPNGTKQTVIIDARGQNVSRETLKDIKNKILEKTNGAGEIIFKMN
jgi:hypothetical protein